VYTNTLLVFIIFSLRARGFVYVSTVHRRAVCWSAAAGFVLCVFSVCVLVRSAVYRAERGFRVGWPWPFVLWNLYSQVGAGAGL